MHSGAQAMSYRGVRMVGIMNTPDQRKGRRCPAVLFLHGLPGAEKSVDVQRELMARGVASFAPHFCGAWGSEGYYTVSGLVPQAEAALRFLSRRPFVDPKRLGVYGFSMGGWAAIHLAAATPALRAAVAVAPVGGPEMVGPGLDAAMARFARIVRAKSAPALAQDFISSVRRLDPAESAARLKSPLLLIHGSSDQTVPSSVSERILRAAGGRARLIRVSGAEHDLLDRRPWLARTVTRWFVDRL